MLNMKKYLETTKIFSRLYLELSSYRRQKLLDVNEKKYMAVPDNFFMFSIQDN